MLVAPLLIFVLLTFIYPIGVMLSRSVQNDIVPETLPETVRVLGAWDASSGELPDEAVYAAFTRDISVAIAAKTHTRLGSRLNYEKTGFSSMFRQSGRKMKKLDPVADAPFKDKLIKIHKGWGDVETWKTLQTYSGLYTSGYFLNAVDARMTPEGMAW